jgi:hypothetical protein
MAFDYATKIQALLAHAENESNPDHVREMFRTKAEELMKAYRIAEEELLATDETGTAPISHVIVIARDYGNMSHWAQSVFSSIALHTGVRHFTNYQDHPSGRGEHLVATVVGYEGDVRYTEFLWTAAYLMFSTRIDPTWSAERTEAENIFLLRNAGIERRKIADAAWGNGREAAARSKVQRIYLREAAARGEEARAVGLSHSTEMYRQAYARAFVNTLRTRLRVARDAANSTGGSLVLHGRQERVDEAFYTLFPRLRPSTEPAVPYVCPDCTDVKKCKIHKERKWTLADEARWQRRYNSPSARAGETSGQVAADGVTIARGHTTASRLDASGRAIES